MRLFAIRVDGIAWRKKAEEVWSSVCIEKSMASTGVKAMSTRLDMAGFHVLLLAICMLFS
jgi:hypothetical protein